MKPLGKTCLIRCEVEEDISSEGGIYIINNSDRNNDSFWKGFVEDYGTLVTDDELKDLPPIGSKIVMTYGKTSADKGGTKLVLSKNTYYIRDINEILGVIDD